MNLSDFRINRLSKNGFLFNKIQSNGLYEHTDLLELSLLHPILLSITIKASDYFSNVDLRVEDEKGNVVENEISRRLNAPNPYQTKRDFLIEHYWYKKILGNNIIAVESGNHSFYNLNTTFLKFDTNFETRFENITGFQNLKMDENLNIIEYDDGIKKTEFNINDLIFIKDIPINRGKNYLRGVSKINSLLLPLSNITKALESKDVILDTNGRELITKSGTDLDTKPLAKGEISNIEKIFSKFGVGRHRKRLKVHNAELKYQSLHIELAELGLDESVLNDVIKITDNFGMPLELAEYRTKKVTLGGDKIKELEQRFYTNILQKEVDILVAKLNKKFFDGTDNLRIVGDFNHLPIFTENEQKKRENQKLTADLILTYRNLGFPDEQIEEILEIDFLISS